MKDPFSLALAYLDEPEVANDSAIVVSSGSHSALVADSPAEDYCGGAAGYYLSLEVNRRCTIGSPVRVTPWLTIIDVEQCIAATLGDLRAYVAARNRGQEHHWVNNLLDEKFERLRICGVNAEIRNIH